jgi:formylglycine-generating enzyme required for sulfatase activity
MKIPLIYRVVAPIILAIFTYTSCAVSETLDRGPSIFDISAVGDVRVVFLNKSYEVTDTDEGIMAMVVENNDYAKNVLIIAEIHDNDKANDVVVRVKNTENHSLTSFFYKSGINFPDRMFMSADGENIEGRFGFYDSSTEKYSVTFLDNNTGESETIRDITLNKNIFSLQHEESASRTETQNLRIQAIYTTLAVWVSLAKKLDTMDDGMARGFFKKLWNVVKTVFVCAAIVVVAVVTFVVAAGVWFFEAFTQPDPNEGSTAKDIWNLGEELINDLAALLRTDSNTGEGHTASSRSLVPLSPPMQWVVPSSFVMGSSDGEDAGAQPAHQVTLSKGFYMGKYQVTQDEYYAVMDANPSYFTTGAASGETQGRCPVEQVSWYDAIVFCNKLSMFENRTPVYRIGESSDPMRWGAVPANNNYTWNAMKVDSNANGYRLPTEAEWEYACRAGTTTAYNTGASISDTTGWYSANSIGKTHEVGRKPANKFGLYDMHGNVKEWCWDWHGVYSNKAVTDPTGPATGTYRIARGGGYVHAAPSLRSAYRYDSNDYIPSYKSRADGFRVVRNAP